MGRLCLLSALLFVVSTVVADDTQTCYFPNGKVATGDRPCASSGTTHCCGKNDICMSNGYCMNIAYQPFGLSRGSCTDSKWGTGCATQCHGIDDNPNGGANIVFADYIDKSYWYCCGKPIVKDGKVVCSDGSQGFTLPLATPMVGYARLQGFVNASDSATATATTSLGTATATSTGSSAAGSTESCDSSTQKQTATETCPKSNEAAVGAGVGASLGAVALAAFCWALWERRRARRPLPGSAFAPPPERGYNMPALGYQAQHAYGSSTQSYPYSHSLTPGAYMDRSPQEASSTPIGSNASRADFPEMPVNAVAVEMMDTGTEHEKGFRR